MTSGSWNMGIVGPYEAAVVTLFFINRQDENSLLSHFQPHRQAGPGANVNSSVVVITGLGVAHHSTCANSHPHAVAIIS